MLLKVERFFCRQISSFTVFLKRWPVIGFCVIKSDCNHIKSSRTSPISPFMHMDCSSICFGQKASPKFMLA